MKKEIQELIPNFYRDQSVVIDSKRLSQSTNTKLPVVRNSSANKSFPEGLSNRNIALWHSHGWYYENTLDRWEWQRARVFQTVEDIWTMSFVVPYITPMLENAGALGFSSEANEIPKLMKSLLMPMVLRKEQFIKNWVKHFRMVKKKALA